MNLRQKLANGMLWTFADVFIIKGISFIGSLYLARTLGPKDFGLLGMVSIFVAVGNTLIESGLGSSLIRSNNVDDRDYSTVFYTNLLLSVGIYSVMYFSAPFIAKFFKQDILINVIRLLCTTFIINGLLSVQLTLLNKKMLFKKIAGYNLPSTLFGLIIGLYLALNGYGVYSLVWMLITTKFVLLIILWFASDWRPMFLFSTEKFNYHFNYGYKLLLSGILNKVYLNVYNVLIGRFYSVQSVGYYERADSFNKYTTDALTGVIKKITFPLLAGIKDDEARISRIYRLLLLFAFFVAMPLMLGLAAVSKPLFELVLGKQWLPAVPFFQILCLSSILYPLHSLNLNVLKIYGRSDLFLRLEIYKKIVTTAGIIVCFQFGIYGLLLSAVLSSVVSLLINTKYSGRLIKYGARHQLADMLPTFLMSLTTLVVILYVSSYLTNYMLIWQISIPLLLGMSIYICLNLFFNNEILYEIISFFKTPK